MTPSKKISIQPGSRLYFIGIGGVGMSALAKVLKLGGYPVSGSDRYPSARTHELEGLGIPIKFGQQEIGFEPSDIIIYSSAIHPDHLEFQEARRRQMTIHHRAEVLSFFFNRAKTAIGVTGTHGKTTTTSMIAFMLSELGKNPTCLVGGEVLNFGTNARFGDPDLWIAEVDESDQTHELYCPHYAVVTNLEEDHLDHYGNLEALKSSFINFVQNAADPGLIIHSADDPVMAELMHSIKVPQLTFGFEARADYRATAVEEKDFGSEFDLEEAGFFVTRVKLSVPGRHNIANALAALAVLSQLGLDPCEMAPFLANFRGARRRLEIKWKSQDLTVIDDYAHHPTEVSASLRALRSHAGRLTAIFQPHRFSRTRHFYKDFGKVLEMADELIVTEVYGAGEKNPDRVSSSLIYDELVAAGHPNAHIMDKNEIIAYLLNRSDLSGTVAFLGAGDIGEIADEFANRLKSLAAA